MLVITVTGEEQWDEANEEFVYPDAVTLELEHSLVSLSKWESIHEKPFLGNSEKTDEELFSYIEMMILTPGVDSSIIQKFSMENFEAIHRYIDSKQTATWFNDTPNAPRSRETITAELVYYWMTQLNIPFSCETWHLGRLFTFIRVGFTKSQKPKKMSAKEIHARNRELNAARRERLGTTG